MYYYMYVGVGIKKIEKLERLYVQFFARKRSTRYRLCKSSYQRLVRVFFALHRIRDGQTFMAFSATTAKRDSLTRLELL
jgi:hypothetical protein